jgi:hypothetical protein
LRADTVTCNRNAPPHEYQRDFTRTSDYGVRISDTAWLKSDGDRIWVTDPGDEPPTPHRQLEPGVHERIGADGQRLVPRDRSREF